MGHGKTLGAAVGLLLAATAAIKVLKWKAAKERTMRTLDAARVELAAEQAAKLQAEERLCKADEESCRTLAKLTVTRAFNGLKEAELLQRLRAAEASRDDAIMSAQKAEARLREAEEENEDNRWRLAAAEAEIKDLLSPPMDSWHKDDSANEETKEIAVMHKLDFSAGQRELDYPIEGAHVLKASNVAVGASAVGNGPLAYKRDPRRRGKGGKGKRRDGGAQENAGPPGL